MVRKKQEKPCELSRGEWLQFFETLLTLKHSNYPTILNTFLVLAILAVTVTASVGIPELDINDSVSVKKYILSIVVTLIFFLSVLGFLKIWIKKILRRVSEEYKAISELIQKIIDGELKESNEIRKEWYKTLDKYPKMINLEI